MESSFVNGSMRSLLIDRTNPSVLYGTTWNGIVKSSDKGGNWTLFNHGLPLNQIVNTLAIDPGNNQVLYAGTDGGVFKSGDGGQNWADVSNRISGFKIYALAIDPGNAGTIYAAVNGSKIFKTTNAGGSWDELPFNVGSGAYSIIIDPAHPQTVYAGLNIEAARVIRSTDAGQNWEGRSTGLAFPLIVGRLVFDPGAQTLYLGTGYLSNDKANGLYRSTNGGVSWQSWSNGLPRTDGAIVFVQAIAIDPGNPSVLFAATGGGLFKSVNGGQTWQQQ